MYKLILCEFTKIKNSKIKYVFLVTLIPVILTYIMYRFNPKYGILEWDYYFIDIFQMQNLFVYIAMFGVFSIYVYGNEYETKTINVIFTYPYSKIKIFFSKLIMICIFMSISIILNGFLALILGLTTSHQVITLNIIYVWIKDLIRIIFFQMMLLPLSVAIINSTKNITASIIILIAISFFNIIIINTKFNTIYPWSIPFIFTPHEFGGRTFTNYPLGMICISIAFVLGMIISIKKFSVSK